MTDAPALRDEAAELFEAGRLGEAAVAAREMVRVEGDDPRAWLLLAQILSAAGARAESCEAFEQVARLCPDLPAVHHVVGLLRQELARHAAAEESFRRAVALAPAHEAYAVALCAHLAARGRHRAVIDFVDRQAAPSVAIAVPLQIQAATAELGCGAAGAALRRLAALPRDQFAVQILELHALRKTERYEEALERCRLLLEAPVSDAAVWAVYALVLQGLGRFAEAAAAFDAGIARTSESAALSVDKAMLFAEFGRLDAAVTMLDEVLARDPDCVAALYNKAQLKRFQPGDPEVERLRSLIGTCGETSPSDLPPLHFALAKALDEVGDIDGAFGHWREGNQLVHALVDYDGEAVRQRFLAAERHFSQAFTAAAEPIVNESEVPVFVVGMPRSGTSLVEQILASHNAIHGAGEQLLLERLIEAPPPTAGADDHDPAWPWAVSPEHRTALGSAYLDEIRRVAPAAARIVDKQPRNLVNAGLIHLILPRARIIHCRRDPLDTCFSCYTKLFAGGLDFAYDLMTLGQYFRWQERIGEHWKRVLPASAFIEVRYEDLVDDLERQARRLIAFCGLDWDAKCLDFDRSPRQVRTASMGQVRRPLYRSSVGASRRYAAYLAPLIEALEGDHRD